MRYGFLFLAAALSGGCSFSIEEEPPGESQVVDLKFQGMPVGTVACVFMANATHVNRDHWAPHCVATVEIAQDDQREEIETPFPLWAGDDLQMNCEYWDGDTQKWCVQNDGFGGIDWRMDPDSVRVGGEPQLAREFTDGDNGFEDGWGLTLNYKP